MERLGFSPDSCMRANPKLVYGRMTGWGQDGPLAKAPGHDINYIALTGTLHAIGRKGGPPVPPLNLIGDFGGGTYLAMGILAAILESKESGKGQIVDAAMIDAAASMMAYFFGFYADGFWIDERGSNYLDTGSPFYDTLRDKRRKMDRHRFGRSKVLGGNRYACSDLIPMIFRHNTTVKCGRKPRRGSPPPYAKRRAKSGAKSSMGGRPASHPSSRYLRSQTIRISRHAERSSAETESISPRLRPGSAVPNQSSAYHHRHAVSTARPFSRTGDSVLMKFQH